MKELLEALDRDCVAQLHDGFAQVLFFFQNFVQSISGRRSPRDAQIAQAR